MSIEALLVAGTRPNFMKIAPVVRAMESFGGFAPSVVHTGQHYDESMSGAFLEELGIAPDEHLGVGPGSETAQFAEIVKRLEPVLKRRSPDVVVVVGDVTSTLAAAMGAAMQSIPVAHVEAGLRSRDWSMPEERNRVVVDRLSRFCFTPSADADDNLRAEGIDEDRIHFVGNVMIDSLDWMLSRTSVSQPATGDFGLVTVHRQGNVDDEPTLRRIVQGLELVSEKLPLVWPMHPRTKARVEAAGLAIDPAISVEPPLPYSRFVALLARARLVLTDSGGIQEESMVLGVPCITLRENTERPVTLGMGANQIVGTEPARVLEAVTATLERRRVPAARPPLWDGRSAERIVATLATRVASRRPVVEPVTVE